MNYSPPPSARRLKRLLTELGYTHRDGGLDTARASLDVRTRHPAPFRESQLKDFLTGRIPLDVESAVRIAEALGFDVVELAKDNYVSPVTQSLRKQQRGDRRIVGSLDAVPKDYMALSGKAGKPS